MDQVIEQVISEVRKRYKRSLLGNMLSWLNKESSDDDEGGINKPTGLPTQLLTKFASFASPSAQAGSRAVSKKSTGPSSHPTASYGPSTQQDPSFINDDKKVSVLRRNSIANLVILNFRRQKTLYLNNFRYFKVLATFSQGYRYE